MAEFNGGAQRPDRSPATGLLCPACRVDLVMSERQGVEIDYCPRCRGVWLDRGELDKILERNAADAWTSHVGGDAHRRAATCVHSAIPGSAARRRG